MSQQAEQSEISSVQGEFSDVLPPDTYESRSGLQLNKPSAPRRLVYVAVGLLVLAHSASVVTFASIFEPNLQFFSYYAVNYDHGFIRRGLGGEILDLFPADLYFAGLLILRWLVPALFVAGIAAVAWVVAVRYGRSERRLMLALLVPMLPFGVVRAVVLPTPDLLGEAALALFVVVLASTNRNRILLIASGVYGLTTAVLTLVHEAIPFLQAVGAILAIVVLTGDSVRMQRLTALFAVAPGVITASVIVLFGRQDASAHCARLPHGAVNFPIQLSPGQVLRGERAYTDYHDWTCRFITVTTSKTPFVGLNQMGWAPLFGSTLVGIAILVVTIIVIRTISCVPFGHFLQVARRRLSWVTLGILLLLPVFATSSDWTRWWVAFSFDLGIVYLLYASSRPECVRPATRRTRACFATWFGAAALFPAVFAIGVAQSVQPMIARCAQLATDPMWVGICP